MHQLHKYFRVFYLARFFSLLLNKCIRCPWISSFNWSQDLVPFPHNCHDIFCCRITVKGGYDVILSALKVTAATVVKVMWTRREICQWLTRPLSLLGGWSDCQFGSFKLSFLCSPLWLNIGPSKWHPDAPKNNMSGRSNSHSGWSKWMQLVEEGTLKTRF